MPRAPVRCAGRAGCTGLTALGTASGGVAVRRPSRTHRAYSARHCLGRRCGAPAEPDAPACVTPPESPLVARVVPDVTGLDKQFDYLVPDEWREDVGAGTIVRVGLAGRRVGGWVVSLGPPDPAVPGAKLRPLAKVTGHGPSAELIDLAAWASRRWAAGRLRPFLLAASPPRAVPALPARAVTAGRPGPVDAGAARLLAGGGGAVRRPPSADPVPVVLAAASIGPALVVCPSVDQARLLGARLRRSGLSVAVVPRDWAAAAGGVDVVVGRSRRRVGADARRRRGRRPGRARRGAPRRAGADLARAGRGPGAGPAGRRALPAVLAGPHPHRAGLGRRARARRRRATRSGRAGPSWRWSTAGTRTRGAGRWSRAH